VWVENMNSVMDDNKLLTLPNSERIRVTDHCKLLFEVADLQYASPATISRCGMVYVDPKNLGVKPFIATWCSQRANEAEIDILKCGPFQNPSNILNPKNPETLKPWKKT
jgi:dynein heavy chain